MAKGKAGFILPQLPRQSDAPLCVQVFEEVRQAILSGRLRAGSRLPSTREMAGDLRVSRNTVVSAFDQLLAEGYVVARRGSGTYVARELPDDLLHTKAKAAAVQAGAPKVAAPLTSARGASIGRIQTSATTAEARAFRPGLPALDLFPVELWGRLEARMWRSAPAELLGFGESAGFRPLRRAIAQYLGAARGVLCSADQVLVVSSSQQALYLAALVLMDAGDAAWVEDPGYLGARGALGSAGARLIPVPLDESGMQPALLDRGPRKPPAKAVPSPASSAPKIIYTTPSHQFPLGITMPLARRLELLRAAERYQAWVLEDDYDSEFRYTSRPVEALQGLDTTGRVIYIGTFSKVLLPCLRLGYLVVPQALVGAFRAALGLVGRHPATIDQAVLAEFIGDGHFERHIRRMRTVYQERQQAIVAALEQRLGSLVTIGPHDSGMHLVAYLPSGCDDVAVSQACTELKLTAAPLTGYCMKPEHQCRHGLVLGYGGVRPGEMAGKVELLARAIESVAKAKRARA